VINVFKAELSRLTRRRFLMTTALAVFAAAVFATVIVFLSAETSAADVPERGTTIDDLPAAGGGTTAFATALSFGGFFVFVVSAAVWAGEFSQGTFRTLLMKQPNRLSLLAGKLAALLVFAAAILLVAEVLMFVVSLMMAPIEDVSTSEWFSLEALGEAAADYGTALFWVTAWSVFAMTLGVVLRSIPLALAVGIGWFGPFEHITDAAWDGANRLYPGLLLERFALGGTDEVSLTRAATLLTLYVAAAAAVGVISFARRDVAT
jgi:ABC-2 type transport system permease protein